MWRALGDYDKAITAYNDALSAGGAAAGFDVIAQLIGAHAYQAADHLRLGRHGPDADHFDRAEELLASWRDLSRPPSDERLKDPALMKAAANLKQQLLWRRVAQGRNRAGLAAALLGVSRAYAEAAGAFTQLGAPRSKDVQYTRLAEEAFAWLAELNGAPRAPIEDGLTPEKRLRAILTEAEDAPWSSAPFERVRVADAKLALHVVTGTPLAADVVAAYTSVFRKGVSKRERDTILHWVELVERCLPRNDPRHQPLQEIAEALSDWVEVPRTTQ